VRQPGRCPQLPEEQAMKSYMVFDNGSHIYTGTDENKARSLAKARRDNYKPEYQHYVKLLVTQEVSF
jgi:hypothetical protein